MHRFLNTLLLGTALLLPVAVAPTALRADDRDDHHKARVYHDNERNEDHEWNDREARAYRMWVKENHRKYRDFEKIKEEDRKAYWGWRHDHTDAILKLDIR